MSDVGYQEYCEKCGAPVVWCKCLEDIDWSLEMRTHIGMEKLGQQVKELRAELARRDASLLTEGEQKEILSYIRGNYDRDKIPCWLLDLIDGVARRDEIIKRLKEDAERLASTYVIEVFPHEWVCRGGCHHWARFGEQIEHSPDCPITLHRALMKELE